MRTLTCVLLLVAAVCADARQVGEKDRYIPLVQNGAGWSTRITLVNLGDTAAGYELVFRPAEGLMANWALGLRGTAAALQNATAAGTIPVGGMVVVETDGEGEAMAAGYAVLNRFDSALIGAEATLRDAHSGAVITLPLSPAREDVVALPYDHTEGHTTRFVWLSETDFAVAEVTAYDEGGRVMAQKSFEFFVTDRRAQQVFDPAAWMPELAGGRGVAVIKMSYPLIGFYDEATFAAVSILAGPVGTSASPGLATAAWAPRRY
jgi:hypothetical protein